MHLIPPNAFSVMSPQPSDTGATSGTLQALAGLANDMIKGLKGGPQVRQALVLETAQRASREVLGSGSRGLSTHACSP